MASRSRDEVMEAILRVVAGGEGERMRIMYGAYLSYEQLEEYAAFMIREGLVYEEQGSGQYKLTEKGEELLRAREPAPTSPKVTSTGS